MEVDRFYDLYGFFNTRIDQIEVQDIPLYNLPINKFYIYTRSIVSKYQGECNRNFHSLKMELDVFYTDLENNKSKFLDSFESEFKTNFYDAIPQLEEVISYYHIEVSEEYSWGDAVRFKFLAYRNALNIIDKYLSEKTKKGKKHIAKREEFHLGLNNAELDELYNFFLMKGFLDEKTRNTDFRNAFSGREIQNHLIWKADAHLLHLLIKQINDEGLFSVKFTHGLWDIVIDVFKPSKSIHGKKPFYDKTSLTKSNPSSKKDYNSIIHEIVERLHIFKNEHE